MFIEVKKPMPTASGSTDQIVLLDVSNGNFWANGDAGYCGLVTSQGKLLVHESFDSIKQKLLAAGELYIE